MSIFEDVPVFISIILGLAVLHLLGGVSLIPDARVKARLQGAHVLWTVSLARVGALAP